MILQMPMLSLPSFAYSISLEGTAYTIQFDYNQRCAAWYMSVSDADGVDIYNGVKVVVGFLLLRKCKDPRRPPGDFTCVTSTSDASPPQIDELLPGSGRCTLLYVTSDWLQTIEQGNSASLLALYAANAQSSATSTYGQS